MFWDVHHTSQGLSRVTVVKVWLADGASNVDWLAVEVGGRHQMRCSVSFHILSAERGGVARLQAAGRCFWVPTGSDLSRDQVLLGSFWMVEWGYGPLVAGYMWRQGCVW